jgi:hypothetical protein
MAYTAYDSAKPDPATQAGTAFGQSARDNIRAMRDTLAATGLVQGFNYSATGGTAEQPLTLFYRRVASNECIKVVLTWGTSGGEDGNVKTATYWYASNESGTLPGSPVGTYSAMADAGGKYIATMTYDSNGNCTATTWS